jgi:cytochrome c peroxidase
MNQLLKNWVSERYMETYCFHTPFNFEAYFTFEDDSFNTDYFTPPANRKPSDKQIALGKKFILDKNYPSTMLFLVHHVIIQIKLRLKTSIDNRGNST